MVQSTVDFSDGRVSFFQGHFNIYYRLPLLFVAPSNRGASATKSYCTEVLYPTLQAHGKLSMLPPLLACGMTVQNDLLETVGAWNKVAERAHRTIYLCCFVHACYWGDIHTQSVCLSLSSHVQMAGKQATFNIILGSALIFAPIAHHMSRYYCESSLSSMHTNKHMTCICMSEEFLLEPLEMYRNRYAPLMGLQQTMTSRLCHCERVV